MTHPDDRLTAIAREQHEGGAHGNHVLAMSQATLDGLPHAAATRALGPINGAPQQQAGLFGIPVLVDDRMGLGDWHLVDRASRAVIEHGTVGPVGTFDFGGLH